MKLMLRKHLKYMLDLSCFQGFSLNNMDYGFVKQLIWLLSRRYPERLGKCLIINSPFIFTGCWAFIRLWLVQSLSQKVFLAMWAYYECLKFTSSCYGCDVIVVTIVHLLNKFYKKDLSLNFSFCNLSEKLRG